MTNFSNENLDYPQELLYQWGYYWNETNWFDIEEGGNNQYFVIPENLIGASAEWYVKDMLIILW